MSSNFNTFDILAVKNALPWLYMTESQARTILIAVADQIADRAKKKAQEEMVAVVIAIVDEQGGLVRIPKAAIESSNRGVLTRFDDPVTGDIVFATHSEEQAVN